MSVLSTIRGRLAPARPQERSGWGGLASMLFDPAYGYPMGGFSNTLGGKVEDIDYDYASFAWRAFMGNPIVFAVEMARVMLFTEARFQFQNMRRGRPGDYWGDRDRPDSRLAVLEQPWPGGTTGDLLKYMLIDHDLAGNAFIARVRADRLLRLRPDWTAMVHGSADPDANMWSPGVEFLGVDYQPGGPYFGAPHIFIQADQVAHFSATPDPLLPLRGMSWMRAVVREIMGDQAMTDYRLRFFEHGATPSMIVKTSFTDPVKARQWVELFKEEHEGLANAYKTLFLSAGSDAQVVGTNLQQIDFKSVQGAGETRIAAAALVPPVVAGLSEGLQGSSLNSGNFQAAMRRFADLTMRPLWRNAAGSLERIVAPPTGTRLWYDDRDIPALKDDIKDAADVRAQDATAMRTLADGGWDPDSVVDAVTSGDMTRLKGKHMGTLPVQQVPGPTNGKSPQPPTDMPMQPGDMVPANGKAGV